MHVLPSIKEGWGLSIIEAARVGVPSVAYRSAGGVQESILDGVTGLLAEDEADLLERVRLLLTDETMRRDMGAKAEVAHRAPHLGQCHRHHEKRAPGLSPERVITLRVVEPSLVSVRNAVRVGLLRPGGAHVAIGRHAAENDDSGRALLRRSRRSVHPSVPSHRIVMQPG